MREPKFALNLPAIIKQTLHRPDRAPVVQAAVVAHSARLVHRQTQELRGVGVFLGRPAFNRSFRGRSTPESMRECQRWRDFTGVHRHGQPRSHMIDFGTAGWIRTTDLLIHSQAL
jgi:hypothetical protein